MTIVKSAPRLRHVLVSALVLASAAAALPASADAPDAPASIKLNYNDLNLSHTAGVKVLYSRIQGAAHKVCEPLSTGRRLEVTIAWENCVSGAVSHAVKSIGQPELTAIFEQDTGKTIPARFASLQVR